MSTIFFKLLAIVERFERGKFIEHKMVKKGIPYYVEKIFWQLR